MCRCYREVTTLLSTTKNAILTPSSRFAPAARIVNWTAYKNESNALQLINVSRWTRCLIKRWYIFGPSTQ